MKKSIVLLPVLFLVALLAYAIPENTEQETTPASQQSMAEQPAPAATAWTVDKIDLDRKTISVKDSATQKTKRHAYNEVTVFFKGDAPVTPVDVKAGDKVSLELDDKGVITSLTVQPDLPPTPEQPPAETQQPNQE